jgi:beta-glucosidase
MRIKRSSLGELSQPGNFVWATGIEDTFITAPWPKTGRRLDEYELTGHYKHWREDLQLVKELGVSAVRYGIPWHKIQPQPNKWDWSFADKTLDLLLELEIEPIVDLVHYGLPPWLDGAFTHPDYGRFVADYAHRVAERFSGRVFAYTPLNEPRITAWYCGKLGWWPPFKRGWRGFIEVMLGVCRGIVETVRAIEVVHPENLPVHVDATDLYETMDPSLRPEVERRQEIVFLALDLISGRIRPGHKLWDWLIKQTSARELEWFQENQVALPIIGINLYPMFSRKILKRDSRGLRISMPYAGGEIIDKLTDLYHERYGCPVFISETASVGSVKRRTTWLKSSVQAVRRTRARGVPLVGYTWWPMFALVTWAYRQGTHPPAYYIKQMGLWDLLAEGDDLRRMETPLVAEYKRLTARTESERSIHV